MDEQLLKYARMAVPRYTSYPTALQFHSGIGVTDYRQWLKAVTPPEPISLYVHIPFCQTLCWYCGCNTTIPNNYGRVSSYLEMLKTEIELTSQNIHPDVKVSHLHFGGGTPSYLLPDHFEQLTKLLKNNFNFLDDAELAVEADPRTLSDDIISAFSNSGITRVSLGIQDFNPKVQALINRIQSEELVSRSVLRLRAAGIKAINFDLMYGLPGQTVEAAQQSAITAAQLKPDRIAVFGYAHVPWFKKHQRVIRSDLLPDIKERIKQADAIAHTLSDEGFIRIGFDHFAQPGDSLSIAEKNGTLRRNFQGYTTDKAQTLIGLGASSISTLPGGYCQNDPHLGQYMSALKDKKFAVVKGVAVDDDDRLRREAINRLMCDFNLNLQELCQTYHRTLDVFEDSLSSLKLLQDDGLVVVDRAVITVPPRGRRFIRNIAACFDQHLLQDQKKHSLAV